MLYSGPAVCVCVRLPPPEQVLTYKLHLSVGSQLLPETANFWRHLDRNHHAFIAYLNGWTQVKLGKNDFELKWMGFLQELFGKLHVSFGNYVSLEFEEGIQDLLPS